MPELGDAHLDLTLGHADFGQSLAHLGTGQADQCRLAIHGGKHGITGFLPGEGLCLRQNGHWVF